MKTTSTTLTKNGKTKTYKTKLETNWFNKKLYFTGYSSKRTAIKHDIEDEELLDVAHAALDRLSRIAGIKYKIVVEMDSCNKVNCK